VLARDELEGNVASGLIVKIDDKIDKIELNSTLSSLRLTKRMLRLNSNLLPSLKRSMERKRELYEMVAPLIDTTSINQKDSLYTSYITAKTQYFSTKEKILNLKSQIVTLKEKIATLRDRISKKSIRVSKRYIYSLDVKRGEFVNVGSLIATVYDISKAKLTLFLSSDELKNIDRKRIYIDGKATDFKFSKIYRIADSKNISSYKAENYFKSCPNIFKHLVKGYKA